MQKNCYCLFIVTVEIDISWEKIMLFSTQSLMSPNRKISLSSKRGENNNSTDQNKALFILIKALARFE